MLLRKSPRVGPRALKAMTQYCFLWIERLWTVGGSGDKIWGKTTKRGAWWHNPDPTIISPRAYVKQACKTTQSGSVDLDTVIDSILWLTRSRITWDCQYNKVTGLRCAVLIGQLRRYVAQIASCTVSVNCSSNIRLHPAGVPAHRSACVTHQGLVRIVHLSR